MPSNKLFTFGNPKTAKGESFGYLTAVLHLAPERSGGTGHNVCPFASPGCIATCLNTAGRGGIMVAGATTNAIQEARKRKTRALFENRELFMLQLENAIHAAQRKAARMHLKLAVRLNGTSDLPFLPMTLARKFPAVTFYDYSKVPATLHAAAHGKLPENYSVTFSQSEQNAAHVMRALGTDVNVAVVFAVGKGKALPSTYLGRRVIDGDTHDLRFLDPRGVIVGLRAKGKAKRDCSGFVVRVAA